MYKDHGLIIKQIPYSDSSRILKCFTLEKGLIPLFARIPKKGNSRGLLQSGSFIEFSANSRANSSLFTLKEVKWDSNMPNQPLNQEAHNTWLFTLELLHKSLAEEMQLAPLHQIVYTYYAHLLYDEVSANPLISLINVAGTLGVIDPYGINNLMPPSLISDLKKLGWKLSSHTFQPLSEKNIFNTELDRFLKHFNIPTLESLYLVDY